MCTPCSRRAAFLSRFSSRSRGATVPAGLPVAQILGGGDGPGRGLRTWGHQSVRCWAGRAELASRAKLSEPRGSGAAHAVLHAATARDVGLRVSGAAKIARGWWGGFEPRLGSSRSLFWWAAVMGEAFSRPPALVLSPLELYNRLQDSRDQILVADAGAEWHEEPEVAIISCEQMKKLLQELATRRARGWTVAAMSTCVLRDLKTWMRAEGLGPGGDCLVKDMVLVSGGAPSFYCSFPFLHRDHEFYELGRLYPSLIATVGGTRLFLSNFGAASDPHTYHALGIKFVVNCTRDLPFVDEVVAILRQRKASEEAVKPINLDAWSEEFT